MSVTSKEIKLSQKVVMEIFFKNKIPSENELYFRGTTLYKQNKMKWEQLDSYYKPSEKLTNTENFIEYDILLYPHGNRWLYALDIPIKNIKNSTKNFDNSITSKKNIIDIKRYSLTSALKYNILSNNLMPALTVDRILNEKIDNALKKLKVSNLTDQQKSTLLLKFFKDQNLTYTLKPQGLDINDPTDSFLFDSKNGYCVHFASAFATTARLIGIPSRVVTGFKATKNNMVNNYLIVRSSDAHAWVELYINKRGWSRFDPTSTASNTISRKYPTKPTLAQKKKKIAIF